MLDLSEGLNLDAMDISEVREFRLMPKAEIARQLGIKPALAEALHIYAEHKVEAMRHRLNGAIPVALKYEANCDRIYDNQIKGQCPEKLW